jgi:hypothetical protein
MSEAIHPLPQYAFIAWCSVKAQGQIYIKVKALHHSISKKKKKKSTLSILNTSKPSTQGNDMKQPITTKIIITIIKRLENEC